MILAPYAFRVQDTAGRRHPEPAHPYRNEYQRDRDRVVHARAFRRLVGKTQVFTRRYSDHFRSRLTHTIEVAQVSRTLAAALELNAELAETLALVHDIGHPPFGHAGEKALDAAMRKHGEIFDHNVHALRIVDDFEQRYIEFRGLNLTFEVREGIIKHSRDWEAAKFPELIEYRLDERPPLEAQLIDLTDEIAYNTADLDDGLEAEILTLQEIREGVSLFDRFYREVDREHPQAKDKLKFNEALKRMLNLLVTDLINTTKARIRDAGVLSVSEVRISPDRLVALSAEADRLRQEAKDFLYAKLYYSPDLLPEKQGAERVVRELFDFYMQDAAQLPPSHQERAEDQTLARTVCDYIAGMTDNFILQQHAKCF